MKPIKVNDWWVYHRKHPKFTGCLIDRDNDTIWFKFGRIHREDGPAIEYAISAKTQKSGCKYWFLDGQGYSEEEHRIIVRKFKLNSILQRMDT